jgi:L-aspartate oxidase
MNSRMAELGVPHLWLDATMVENVEDRFPTVAAACRKAGIDIAADWIPVAPGAHYACGGVAADMDGRTSLPGLFAVGEVARTGVHGANRLASNSLTEAMITGRRLGEALGDELPSRLPCTASSREAGLVGVGPVGAGPIGAGPIGAGPIGAGLVGVAPAARPMLAAAMSRLAGVQRDRAGLEELLRLLSSVPQSATLDLATVEATSLHTVSTLVATAALARTESRGCHRRSDISISTEVAA